MQYELFFWVFILVAGYTQGADTLVDHRAFYLISARDISPVERTKLLQSLLASDQHPRMGLILMIATSVTMDSFASQSYIPVSLVPVVWFVTALWTVNIWAGFLGEGKPWAESLVTIDIYWRYLLGAVFLIAAIWSLIGDGPFADFTISGRYALFGMIIIGGVSVRFFVIDLQNAWPSYLKTGSTPEFESIMRNGMGNAIAVTWMIWILYAVIVILVVFQPSAGGTLISNVNGFWLILLQVLAFSYFLGAEFLMAQLRSYSSRPSKLSVDQVLRMRRFNSLCDMQPRSALAIAAAGAASYTALVGQAQAHMVFQSVLMLSLFFFLTSIWVTFFNRNEMSSYRQSFSETADKICIIISLIFAIGLVLLGSGFVNTYNTIPAPFRGSLFLLGVIIGLFVLARYIHYSITPAWNAFARNGDFNLLRKYTVNQERHMFFFSVTIWILTLFVIGLQIVSIQ